MTQVALGGETLRDSFVEIVDTTLGAQRGGLGFDIDLDALTAATLRQSRQAVCVTDARVDQPGPTIAYVNAAYAEIFGCQADAVIGRTPRDGQGALTNRRVLDRLRSHLEAGQSIEAQAINYRTDRTPFRLRWTIDPIRRHGAIVGFLGMMRDITVEDRMRRRLVGLDTLMTRGHVVATMPVPERSQVVADALAASIRPIMAEIGTAGVRIASAKATTAIDVAVLDVATPIEVVTPIGSFGAVTAQVHPDAGPLLDRVALNELAEHARWLCELGEQR